MKTISLTFDENNKPIIKGNFEFDVTLNINDGLLKPGFKIGFVWSKEMEQDLETVTPDQYNELWETIGNKLKQDFLDTMKNQ